MTGKLKSSLSNDGIAMMMKKIAAVTLITTALAGCASVEKTASSNHAVNPSSLDSYELSHHNIHILDQTLHHRGKIRGGAAYLESGYVHTLGKRLNEMPAVNETDAFVKNVADLDHLQHAIRSTKPRGYSHYELSRWERYCNEGKGMDERDWLFIKKEDTSHTPIYDCRIPKNSMNDYMAAWHSFCSSKTLTKEQLEIVKNTVRPHSFECPKATKNL